MYINVFVFCALFSWTLRTAGTENAAVINQVWREILQVHACPSWLRPGGSLGHLKGTHFRGQWTRQIFQPELLENTFGAKPPKRVIRKFPRDSRPAVCHATACVPPSCHEARPPWAGFRDGDLPPPFPGGVGFWHPPVFQGSQLRWRQCVVFLPKRNGVSKLLTL